MLLYTCISIICISLLLSIYSFKENKLSLLLSAYFIILATYGLTHNFTVYQKSAFWFAIFYNHFTPLWVMAGPFLYLYVEGTLFGTDRLRKYGWIHFSPSIIYCLSVGPYFFKPFSEKIKLVHQIHTNIEYLKYINPNLFFSPEINFTMRPSLLLLYSLLSFVLVFKFYYKEYTSENIPSTQVKMNIRWLFTLTSTSIALALSFLIISIKFLSNPATGYQLLNHPLHIVTGLVFLILTIALFFFPEILFGISNVKKNKNINPEIKRDNPSNKKPGNDEKGSFIDLSHKITEYLKNEKPYLSKTFSMHDIAFAMNEPNHNISYCINHVMQTNFTDLKNKHRIEHFFSLIEQNEISTLSIEGLSKKCGFATRSSFYRAFKKVTGKKPTELISKYSIVLIPNFPQ